MMNVLTDACIPHPASMGNTLYRIPWRADKTSGGFQFFCYRFPLEVRNVVIYERASRWTTSRTGNEQSRNEHINNYNTVQLLFVKKPLYKPFDHDAVMSDVTVRF